MKDKVILAVTSERGTRQFRIGRRFYRVLKVAGCSVALGVFVSTGVIYYLTQKSQALEVQSMTLTEEVASLTELKQTLESDLQSREEEMQLVSDRLGDLEKLLGVDSGEENIISRLDVATIHSSIRLVMLNQIPSGSPVKQARISSGYGRRVHPVTGKVKFHRGQDFAVNTGTPVYAPADGVVQATRSSSKGSGNFLRLQHSFGFSSSYSHLNRFSVRSGTFVKKGDLIGYSGNSGLTSGPHLHYEIRFVDRPLNPRPFVDWGMNNFESIFTKIKSIHWDTLVARVESRVSQQMGISSRGTQIIAGNANVADVPVRFKE
ncbi:M23 family metallopeptidase [Vibrio mangrovi]|uniref:M23 family metallopeptidase n=1 Tax=Vibrio mangrovi TaxID=474394 RepID=A0A1Y6IVS2_9VIBR|nr:M23 family metallopeptidase [Vibrio mangrovi]MDW6004962.1 M23 family metallopeptidase [Vibrio mangrovi]SMS01726.1 Murein DD-endopeptidase MepM [Vibrio mangrovi]